VSRNAMSRAVNCQPVQHRLASMRGPVSVAEALDARECSTACRASEETGERAEEGSFGTSKT
jgi:hypothetical protein